jgi:recombination protein RecA
MNLDKLRKSIKNDMLQVDKNYQFFLTGNPMLDAFIGSGGLPKYQLEYIWATNSVGKSTLAIQILASYQKQLENQDYIILYYDTEESVTYQRLRNLGVIDSDNLFLANPESIEKAGDHIFNASIESNNAEIFVIWDTIAQTPSEEENNNEIKIGMSARALTKLFKRLKFSKLKLTMFALNQHRDDVTGNKWAPKEPVVCNAVKHKSFLNLSASKKNSELLEKDIGFTTTFKTSKSKIISPHRMMEFEATYVNGYDSPLTLINFYRKRKLIGKKGGGYFYFTDDKDKSYRLKDFYEYLLTNDSVDRWKYAIETIYSELYKYDDQKLITEAKERIYNYYFENDEIQLDRFTSISNLMIASMEEDTVFIF